MRVAGLVLLLLVLLSVPVNAASVIPRPSSNEVEVGVFHDIWGGVWRFYSDGSIVVEKDGENLTLNMLGSASTLLAGLSKLHVSQARLHVVNKTFCVFTVQLPGGELTYYIKWSTLMPRAKITIKAKIPMVSGLSGKKLAFKMLSLQPHLTHIVKTGKHWIRGKHLFFDYRDVLHAVSKHRNKGWRLLGSSVNGLIFSVSSENIVIDPEIGYTEGDVSWTAYSIDYSSEQTLISTGGDDGHPDCTGSSSFTFRVRKPVYVTSLTVYPWFYDIAETTVYLEDYNGHVLASGTINPDTNGLKSVTINVNRVLSGTYRVVLSAPSSVVRFETQHGAHSNPLVEVEYITAPSSASWGTWSWSYSHPGEPYPYHIVLHGYPPIEGNITKHYISYSSDNTTYTYYYSPEYTIVRVPGGEEITGGEYSVLGTDNGDLWINMTGDVTTTAWNRIYSITTDKSIYGHGQTIQVNVTVVDEYGDPVSGEEVTVWAGVSQYPCNVTLSLSNVVLAGNQTIAPHLYNLYFDGQDDYVKVTGFPNLDAFTVILSIKTTTTSDWGYVIAKASRAPLSAYDAGWRFSLGVAGASSVFDLISNTSYSRIYGDKINDGIWHTVALWWNGTTQRIYIDDELKAEATFSDDVSNTYPLTIGSTADGSYFEGNIAFVQIYNDSLENIKTSTIVNTTNMRLFLDPTFYNGTHYINLVNESIIGTPYGGVQRVPAESKWLWLVDNTGGDGLVHLRFFPVGSIVNFVNATDGTVVREVFIDSDDVAVSLPSGTYNVTAIITYGDYYTTTATTDSNGVATVSFTAPDYDAYVVIQANCTGGVKNTTVKVTDIAYSYTYNETVYKNDVDELKLSAWHTLDTTPVQGSFAVRDYWGNTTVVDINNGQGSWTIPTNRSGSYSFFIDWVYDAENEIAKQVDKAEYYQVAGLNTRVESDTQFYAMLNSNVTVNLTTWYDDGYVIYPNTTANVTIIREFPDHTETNTTTYNITNGQLILTIPVTTENQLTINYEIQDFGNYTAIASWAIPVDAILLDQLETIGDYDHSELTAKLKTRSGLVGKYEGALFILDDVASDNTYELGVEGDQHTTLLSTLKLDRVFYRLNDTVNITLTLLNYNASVRTYNITLEIEQPYKGLIGSANDTITVYANSIGTATIPVQIETNRAGFAYINISVTDGYETISYYGVLPALIGYNYPENYSIIKIIPFSSNDFNDKKLVSLTVESIKQPSGEPWFALPIINNVLLTTLAEIQRYNVSELARVNATIAVPDEILESGDTVKINVTLASEFPIECTVYVYAGDATLYYNGKFTITNNTLSLVYTVPRMEMNTLETIPIKVVVINNWNQRQIGFDEKTISVFNTPPTIMLVEPSLNAVLNGTVSIIVYAYDDSGIKDDQILWRWEWEEDWHNETLVDSYANITVDTRQIPNGLARMIVRAEDNHGNVADEVFYFTIDNPEFTSEFYGKWSRIANLISRYIFLPGVATSIVTMLLGAFVMWAITKLKQKGKQVVYVIEKKVEEGGKE